MLSISDPPQNCLPPLNSTTIQGHAFGCAFVPPTIRSESSAKFLAPQPELIGRTSEGAVTGLKVVRMVVELLQAGNVDRVGHVVIVGRAVVEVVGTPAPPPNPGACVAAVWSGGCVGIGGGHCMTWNGAFWSSPGAAGAGAGATIGFLLEVSWMRLSGRGFVQQTPNAASPWSL